MCRTRIYRIWAHIKTRTTNSNAANWNNYGGRGIKICDRWLDFRNFLEDMRDGYKDDLSIERIDNNKDYSKENCRWATRKEQCNNKRNNRMITFKGERKSISDWSRELKINYRALQSRLDLGWSVERTLTQPVKRISTSKN